MTRALLIGLAALAGGCSADVQMVLAPIGGCDSECGASDMSCVTYLGVVAVGEADDEVTTACIRLDPGAMQSLCVHDLADAIALQLPDNLTAVEVQGFASELGCGYTTLFGGYSEYAGQRELRVDVSCNLDCSTFAHREFDVRVVDLDSLSIDGTCRAPAEAPVLDVALGVTQDYRRYTTAPFYNVAFEQFYEVGMTQPASSTGLVHLAGGSYDVRGEHGRCLSVDAFVPIEGAWNTSCVSPSQRQGVCGAAGELEMAWVTEQLSWYVERVLSGLQRYDWYHVGLAWDANGRRPIAGATVTGLPQGVVAVYFDRTVDGLVARGQATTGTSGLFAIVGDMVGPVQVTAPGFAPASAVVAVASHSPSGGIVSMQRAP